MSQYVAMKKAAGILKSPRQHQGSVNYDGVRRTMSLTHCVDGLPGSSHREALLNDEIVPHPGPQIRGQEHDQIWQCLKAPHMGQISLQHTENNIRAHVEWGVFAEAYIFMFAEACTFMRQEKITSVQ